MHASCLPLFLNRFCIVLDDVIEENYWWYKSQKQEKNMSSMHHNLVSLVCLVSNKHVVFVSLWQATHWQTYNPTGYTGSINSLKFLLVDRLLVVTQPCRCFFNYQQEVLKSLSITLFLLIIISSSIDSPWDISKISVIIIILCFFVLILHSP